jgi:hypothetical protein
MIRSSLGIRSIHHKILGFKGTDHNMQSDGFQYQIGKTFTSKGFQFYMEPVDVLFHHSDKTDRFFIVEASGQVTHDVDKSVCSDIKIIKEIQRDDFVRMIMYESKVRDIGFRKGSAIVDAIRKWEGGLLKVIKKMEEIDNEISTVSSDSNFHITRWLHNHRGDILSQGTIGGAIRLNRNDPEFVKWLNKQIEYYINSIY